MSLLGGLAVKILLGIVAVPTLISAGYYLTNKYRNFSTGEIGAKARAIQEEIEKSLTGGGKCNPISRTIVSQSDPIRFDLHGGGTHSVHGHSIEHHTVECSSYSEVTKE